MISKNLKITNKYSTLNSAYIEGFILSNPYNVFMNTLFNSNNKLGGIATINFETALNCTSAARGYCSICNNCYAINDALQYNRHHLNTISTAAVINTVMNNNVLFDMFNTFLKIMNIKIIRYNIVGDFKDASSILFLKKLCLLNPNIKFYGYSKRLDLKDVIKNVLKSCSNFYVGGSLKLYKDLKKYGCNYYYTTANIKKYVEAKNICGGSCLKCNKCFNIKGGVITCFIHGAPSKIQKLINTPTNNEYLTNLINKMLDLNIQAPKKGLFITKYKIALLNVGVNMPKTIKNINQFLKWLKFYSLYKCGGLNE